MKTGQFLLAALFAFSLNTITTGASFAADALHIVDAEIPMPPPGVPVMAGFAKVMNHSADEVVVVSASSDSFSKVEFHLTTVKDDIARMRKIKELAIPADSMVKLAHGDTHLMLSDPIAGLEPGSTVEVELELASGETMIVSFELVEGMHAGGHKKGHDMKKMDHGDMNNKDHKLKN